MDVANHLESHVNVNFPSNMLHHSTNLVCSCLNLSSTWLSCMGQLSAKINTRKRVSIEAEHKDVEREKSYSSCTRQGKPICKAMFCFIHGICEKQVNNLSCSLKENGLNPCIHGSIKRKPKHALSFQSIEFIVKFIFN